MKIGDKVEILKGLFAGQKGKVEAIADAPISIGIRGGADLCKGMLVWFKPDEVKLIK